MPRMVEIVCANPACRKVKMVRAADVARGWGKTCCRACAAMLRRTRTVNEEPSRRMVFSHTLGPGDFIDEQGRVCDEFGEYYGGCGYSDDESDVGQWED